MPLISRNFFHKINGEITRHIPPKIRRTAERPILPLISGGHGGPDGMAIYKRAGSSAMQNIRCGSRKPELWLPNTHGYLLKFVIPKTFYARPGGIGRPPPEPPVPGKIILEVFSFTLFFPRHSSEEFF